MNTTILAITVIAVALGTIMFRTSRPEMPFDQIRTLVRENGALLLDVRSSAEFAAGHVSGAVNIAHSLIASSQSLLPTDKSSPIVVYCLSGHRAQVAQQSLKSLGYTTVINAGSYAVVKNKLK